MHGKVSSHFFPRLKKIITAAFSAVFLLLLLLVPAPALSGARHGLSICGETVIPSLFPFLVLSMFIIGSGLAEHCGRLFKPLTRLLFNLPGCAGTAIILGAVGGYPVGAKAVAQLCENGLLSKKDGERLLCFAINSSPAFIIGAVGAGFFSSAAAGMLLYAAHLSASFTIGLLMRGKVSYAQEKPAAKKLTAPRKKSVGIAEAFVSSVTGSAQSIIAIAAFVVLFSSLTALLNYTGATAFFASLFSKFMPLPAADAQFYHRAIAGLLEVTNGCAAASGSYGLPAVLLTAAVLGFSGLSVQFQVIAMTRSAGLSTRLFILTRFLHAALSVFFAWMFFSVFPAAMPPVRSVQTIASGASYFAVSFHSMPAVCAMLFICAILLLSLAQV